MEGEKVGLWDKLLSENREACELRKPALQSKTTVQLKKMQIGIFLSAKLPHVLLLFFSILECVFVPSTNSNQIRVANNPFGGKSKNTIQVKFNQQSSKLATSTKISGDLRAHR